MIWNVRTIGARGDGLGPDTCAIQSAIDRCAQEGGVVVVPAGSYLVGTLHLRSRVVLRLEAGAKLIGSTDIRDYPDNPASFVDAVGQARGRCLILAHGVQDVALEGEGTIDGQGGSFVHEDNFPIRPFLVRFVGCQDARISGVTMLNSAAWVCHLMECRRVTIDNVRIRSRVNENNDGIDIDSCQDVRITDCDIDSGDDSICLKSTTSNPCSDVAVEDCVLRSACGTIKIGTESYGDFSRIAIRRCKVMEAGLCGIKVLAVDGGNVEDISITDIDMVNTTGPLFVRLGDRGRVYGGNGHPPIRKGIGTMRGVRIERVSADVIIPVGPKQNYFSGEWIPPRAFSGMHVSCVDGQAIEDFSMTDCRIKFCGGGQWRDESIIPPEQRADYPEHFYFGVLPSYGLYMRNVRDSAIEGLKMELSEPDARPSICLDGCARVRMSGIEKSILGPRKTLMRRCTDIALDDATQHAPASK